MYIYIYLFSYIYICIYIHTFVVFNSLNFIYIYVQYIPIYIKSTYKLCTKTTEQIDLTMRHCSEIFSVFEFLRLMLTKTKVNLNIKESEQTKKLNEKHNS